MRLDLPGSSRLPVSKIYSSNRADDANHPGYSKFFKIRKVAPSSSNDGVNWILIHTYSYVIHTMTMGDGPTDRRSMDSYECFLKANVKSQCQSSIWSSVITRRSFESSVSHHSSLITHQFYFENQYLLLVEGGYKQAGRHVLSTKSNSNLFKQSIHTCLGLEPSVDRSRMTRELESCLNNLRRSNRGCGKRCRLTQQNSVLPDHSCIW